MAINSPETIAAINYAKALYDTFIPGTESWQDINNNRAFLAGQVSLTANGVSLYYAAKKDEKLKDMAADLRATNFPIGPVGTSVELHQTTQAVVFNHTKFPNACKAYLKFMYEAEQMNAWITGSSAYCCQPLKAFASNPVWTADPMHAPYAKASETLRPNGYAGPLGLCIRRRHGRLRAGRHVRVRRDRRGHAGRGVAQAEKRANRYYKV